MANEAIFSAKGVLNNFTPAARFGRQFTVLKEIELSSGIAQIQETDAEAGMVKADVINTPDKSVEDGVSVTKADEVKLSQVTDDGMVATLTVNAKDMATVVDGTQITTEQISKVSLTSNQRIELGGNKYWRNGIIKS